MVQLLQLVHTHTSTICSPGPRLHSSSSPISASDPFSAPTLPLASAQAKPSPSAGGSSTYKEVQLLKSQGLKQVKVFDSDPVVLQALVGSDIKVTIGLRLYSTSPPTKTQPRMWRDLTALP
ncbi:hypothetical protein ACFX2I_012515 [Malus domestica]